jgi:hypothetical protein
LKGRCITILFCYDRPGRPDWCYHPAMDTATIAKICAGLAVVATLGWSVLGYFGIRTLKDIRNELHDKRTH